MDAFFIFFVMLQQKTNTPESIKGKDKGIPFILFPPLLLLLVYAPLWLLADHLVREVIVFAPCLIMVWVLSRRFAWDEGSILCLFSGLLVSLSYPDTNLILFSFIGYIPFLFALERSKKYLHSLFYGVILGATQVLLAMSWGRMAISNISFTGKAMGFIYFLPFTIILNIKTAVFALVYHWNKERLHIRQLFFLPAAMGILEIFKLELYPWYLGLSLVSFPSFIQAIDLIGLPGIAFLIILVNVTFFRIISWRFSKEKKAFPSKDLAIAGFLILAAIVYGQIRISQIRSGERNADRFLAVALIQPDSPLTISKNQTELREQISRTIFSLAERAAEKEKPDLIAISEGAVNVCYQTKVNPDFIAALEKIPRELGVPIIFDNDYYLSESFYYRQALLLSPEMKITGEYYKRKLAPFGEYIPLVSYFPFLRKIFIHTRNYKKGRDLPIIRVKGVQIIPQICYESIYPGLTRQYVRKGGELIVNLTNDKWYGSEKQARQHLALSRFRCIENRIPMVRATNNGISAYISSTGTIMGKASPYGKAWSDSRKVPLTRSFSFYREFGDVFGYLCLLYFLIIIFSRIKFLFF
jgi:apolipoprotein N-acyltransferase